MCILLNNAGKYCDRSTYRSCRFWQKKNHLFRWSSCWSWQNWSSKIVAFGAQKTRHCLVRILVQRHNWAIFLRKWARRGRNINGDHSLLDHVERIFVHKNWRGWYWQHLVSTGRRYVPRSQSYTRCLRPVFEDCIISRRADVVWSPRSCYLTPLDYYLWGAFKDKYYVDKPETIGALKDNIRETIGKIHPHTDRVGYCMASRGSHLNEIKNHWILSQISFFIWKYNPSG